MTTGDFNNDKKLDLAVSGVNVALGNGDGTFQPPINTNGGLGTIEAGDLNGDGNLDLVLDGHGRITVLLGDGTGHFPTTHTYSGPVGPTSQALAVRDLNGDGHPDIVAFSGPVIGVFLNRGDGSLAPGKLYIGDGAGGASGTSPFAFGLIAADLNGDQKVDLAFANYATGISVLPGNGNGTFKGNLASLGDPGPYKVGTFDGDLEPDMVPVSYSRQILLGRGDGTFAPKITNCNGFLQGQGFPLAIGDFNQDGKLDLAGIVSTSGVFSVGVCLGNGDGTFTETSGRFDQGVEHQLVLARDFNDDGRLDLAVSDKSGFSILLGNGDGTFQNGIPTAVSSSIPFPPFVVADFNNDGKLDIAAATSSGFSAFLGRGDGTFQAPIASSISFAATNITVTDLNKDGKRDLVLVKNGQSVVVMLGKGDGTFQTPVSYTCQGCEGAAVIGDFNLDGNLDVAVIGGTSDGEAAIDLFFGDGTGKLLTPTQVRAGGPIIFSLGLTTADFNGDHKPDLALSLNTGYVETFLHQ